MKTHIASSADELERALKKASGGDVIELAPGDYGNFSMRRTHFDTEVTIKSADPDNPAVFNWINIVSSSNLTFDSIFIDFTPTENTVEWMSAFRAAMGVSGITLRNSKIEGGDSIGGISPDSEPGEQGKYGILGEPIGRAITATGTNLTIENNEISHFKDGIVTAGRGNQILDNEIYDLRTSPVRGNGWDLTIDGNYFHDSNPWKTGGRGDHGDYVHLWTSPNGSPMRNITITNNVFSDENGGELLGIYLDDNRRDIGFKGVIIEDNVIYSGTGQAVRFENVSDATIARNTILNPDDSEMRGSQLVFKDGTKDIHLEGNIVSTFFSQGAQEALAEKGFTFKDNLDVEYDDPNAENYIGRILTDSRVEGSGLWERAVVPGSVADGLGAAVMHLEDQPDRLTPVFEVEKAIDEGTDFILRADLSRGPEGALGASSALFVWDFGDGTGATGQVVRHSYADSGRYDTTLTVVTPDGTTAVAQGEVAIMGGDMLSFDPVTGMFETERYGETTQIEGSDRGSVALGEDYGLDIRDKWTAVTVDKSMIARLFGADNFDMSMTLRADTPGSTGEVARIHSNFMLSVENRGEIEVKLWTDEGFAKLTTVGTTINDGQEHDIRIAFDSETSRLEIHVDETLAAATDIEGKMRGDFPRNLDFGNPWGKDNFDSTLTAFDLNVGNQDYPDYAGDVTALPSDAVPTEDLPGTTAPEEDASPSISGPFAVFADFQADRLEVTTDETLVGDTAAPAAQEEAPEIISLIGSARSDAIRATQTIHDDDALDDPGAMDVFVEEASVL